MFVVVVVFFSCLSSAAYGWTGCIDGCWCYVSWCWSWDNATSCICCALYESCGGLNSELAVRLCVSTLVSAAGGVGPVGMTQPGSVIIVSNLDKTVRFLWSKSVTSDVVIN